MGTRLILFICLVLLSVASGSAQEQTLTDLQGRQLTATILGVQEGAVLVRRTDGKQFSLPLEKLDLTSRKTAMNWNRQEILSQQFRAFSHLFKVREKAYSRDSNEFYEAAGLLGEAFVEAGRPADAIPLLEMTVAGMDANRIIDWREPNATSLLGFARVSSDINDETGYDLMVEGFESLSTSRDRLPIAKRNWLKYRAAQRLAEYTAIARPEEHEKWARQQQSLFGLVVNEGALPFEAFRMKRRESEHFRVASPYSETSTFLKMAESGWEFYADIFPSLRERYEGGKFAPTYRLPRAFDKLNAGMPVEPFKFTLFLTPEELLFELVENYAEVVDDEDEGIRATRAVEEFNQFYDSDVTFYATESADPDTFEDRDDNYVYCQITHELAEINLIAMMERSRAPGWMEIGLGYCAELAVIGTLRYYYSGYEYPDAGLLRGEVWFEPIRNLVERGYPVDLKKSIDYEGDRMVHDVVYMFAFIHMLLAEEETKQKFADLVVAQGTVERFMRSEEIAIWFGYDSADALETAIASYILSPAFE